MMRLVIQEYGNHKIAICETPEKICSEDEIVDILGNAYYEGATSVIIKESDLCDGFFDLKTKIAGNMLQKFSNYRMKLAIIGEFTKYNSKSLHDFIHESNKSGLIFFVHSAEEAFTKLS